MDTEIAPALRNKLKSSVGSFQYIIGWKGTNPPHQAPDFKTSLYVHFPPCNNCLPHPKGNIWTCICSEPLTKPSVWIAMHKENRCICWYSALWKVCEQQSGNLYYHKGQTKASGVTKGSPHGGTRISRGAPKNACLFFGASTNFIWRAPGGGGTGVI